MQPRLKLPQSFQSHACRSLYTLTVERVPATVLVNYPIGTMSINSHTTLFGA